MLTADRNQARPLFIWAHTAVMVGYSCDAGSRYLLPRSTRRSRSRGPRAAEAASGATVALLRYAISVHGQAWQLESPLVIRWLLGRRRPSVACGVRGRRWRCRSGRGADSTRRRGRRRGPALSGAVSGPASAGAGL